MKNLVFNTAAKDGKSKCHWMHVGKPNVNCSAPRVHKEIMEEVQSDTYLGDIVSNNGKNSLNISSRVSKGLGIISQIFNILEQINFGTHFIEVGLLLRESMLINGILTNGEVWYNITKDDIKELDKVDLLYLQKLLKIPFSTPREAIFLELGIQPIESILRKRRLNFLYYLIKRDQNSMLFKFFMAQYHNPSPGDWCMQINEDLKDTEISMSFAEIQSITKYKFTKLVKEQVTKFTLKVLLESKDKHSKMKNVNYEKLKIQPYFIKDSISTHDARNIFRYRTRMLNFKENYKGNNNDDICPLCKKHTDDQNKIESCTVLKENINDLNKCRLLYTDTTNEEAIEILSKVMDIRNNILT